MPSKFGFETDEAREIIQQFREIKRLEDRKVKEDARREEKEKKFAELFRTQDEIHGSVRDILEDFANASPSYFSHKKSLIIQKQVSTGPTPVKPLSFDAETIWGLESFPDYQILVQLDSLNKPYPPNLPYHQNALSIRRESALDFVSAGKIEEDVFFTWTIANSLAVMLIWQDEANEPGLKLLSRIGTIPKGALEALRKTVEEQTSVDCTLVICDGNGGIKGK